MSALLTLAKIGAQYHGKRIDMSMHAVRDFVLHNGFDALVSALEDRVQAGHVRAMLDPVVVAGSCRVLYCYTQSAVVDRAWDGVVDMARGLILDLAARTVVATPFTKFFNHGEVTSALPSEAFEVFDKLDGSLGVIWHDGMRWRVSTKGSFTSPQAMWASAWLGARDTSDLTPGHTYCAEIIYAANQIVVRYPFEGLVFLAAWDAEGREYDCLELRHVAADLGARCVERFHFDGFDAIRGVLTDAHDAIVRDVVAEVVRLAGESDKDVGLNIEALSPMVRPFIFTARRAGPGWQHSPKARTGIFRLIRPTGNALPGYAPSGALANAMEEIAG